MSLFPPPRLRFPEMSHPQVLEDAVKFGTVFIRAVLPTMFGAGKPWIIWLLDVVLKRLPHPPCPIAVKDCGDVSFAPIGLDNPSQPQDGDRQG
jgi:hypothetical protein